VEKDSSGLIVNMAQYFELNDGQRMPSVGLGTFQGNYDYFVSSIVLLIDNASLDRRLPVQYKASSVRLPHAVLDD